MYNIFDNLLKFINNYIILDIHDKKFFFELSMMIDIEIETKTYFFQLNKCNKTKILTRNLTTIRNEVSVSNMNE